MALLENLGFITHLLPRPSGFRNVSLEFGDELQAAPWERGGRGAARLCVWLLVSPSLALLHHSHQPSKKRRARAGMGHQLPPVPHCLAAQGAVFGGANLQPSPDRSGVDEAQSDFYFLGHVFTDSQLKLGS